MPHRDEIRSGRQSEVDRLGEEFAREFQAGFHPRIEDYISRSPALRSELLSKLIPLEIELRQAIGEQVSPEDYQQRFPGGVTRALAASLVETSHTLDFHASAAEGLAAPHPQQLGRYEVLRILGRGGFGVVYLAHDPQLDRQVALKVPRHDRFATRDQMQEFFQEARTAARLKHPLLVAVYDVQEQGDLPYIVQEYVPGRNLDQWRVDVRPSFEQIARLLASVAEAVGYLHQEGLIHCDLKPANVLIDGAGQPHVADFGLATHESAQHLLKGQSFGTPTTMAPEQVRGESHLLDGRTDIWALGAMLYQLLTGRMPFVTSRRDELFEMIRSHDPKPPRQIERGVPKELERICLKCLSRRRTDRYNTADDLRDDLLAWLSDEQAGRSARPTASDAHTSMPSSSVTAPVDIVPKGLRAYDAEDADFFLDLLPGPRDRERLPESIRFWRNRIEQLDPDQTFRVGLIYGPSGSGKSSLVKAGLLPRLSKQILPIYVEATAADTEVRILKQLRKHLPSLPPDASLPEICAGLRQTGGVDHAKVLLVIDQFEQWLHAHPHPGNTELVDALRQCEGGKLQALLMVRDDFYLSVNRVFQELEVRLLEGSNCGVVDLFDLSHSRKVLTALGRAYGKLGDQLTAEEEQFLTQAIDELAEDHKVICVRLALFADMMKSRPWVPASLQAVGGVGGVGVAILEETFSSSSAPLAHRVHEAASRRVLKALLPAAGTDIKGSMQSANTLRQIAGYADKPREFDELIEILDSEARLITPTDADGTEVSAEDGPPARYYQLTHDYLVPSLRTWLTRKQSERWKGRAELRLAEIAAHWTAKPENRRLPATWEHLSIRLLTSPRSWSTAERKVMRAAARVHGRRWGLILVVLLILGGATWHFASAHTARVAAERAELLIDTVLTAPASAVPYAFRNLEPHREQALPVLRRRFAESDGDPVQRLRIAVMLTQFGEPHLDELLASIENSDGDECPNLVSALTTDRTAALASLHPLLHQADSQRNWRLKARLALTMLQLGDTSAVRQMLALRPDPIERVTLIDTMPQWHGPVDSLVASVLDADPDPFRSGICLGVGSIPLDDLSSSELNATIQTLQQWYQAMPHAGTHSAAAWALRRWQQPLPDRESPVGERADWQVNSLNMTMVRIPPLRAASASQAEEAAANPAETVDLLPTYWLSDLEISVSTFKRFVDDPQYPPQSKPDDWAGADDRRSPSPEHPVQQVSWIHAVLFCNWLSHREQRDPCYEWDGEVWQLVSGAGGYRLPTEAEWEHACRAGVSTDFVSGSDEQFLDSYAVYQSNQTAPCGSKMPNAWGLFDVHGNVYEWGQDWFEPNRRVILGGAFDYPALKARATNRESNVSKYRSYTIGFRIARDGP